jgi:predicted acetyltransferase
MNLTLRKLTAQDEKAFFEGMKAWEGESLSWYSFAWKEGMTYSEMLTLLENESAGINLAPNRVPHTMLYGFVNDQIIGRVSIRHTLNQELSQRGGHMGYAVAPRYRRQGYATTMTRLGLKACKELGLTSILLTCSDDNLPSWKIIEHLNGKLETRTFDTDKNEWIRRYWIDLNNQAFS